MVGPVPLQAYHVQTHIFFEKMLSKFDILKRDLQGGFDMRHCFSEYTDDLNDPQSVAKCRSPFDLSRTTVRLTSKSNYLQIYFENLLQPSQKLHETVNIKFT